MRGYYYDLQIDEQDQVPELRGRELPCSKYQLTVLVGDRKGGGQHKKRVPILSRRALI